MTPERAAYFMRRFKKEEKLLGPNEQAAVDYVIALLEQPSQAGLSDEEAKELWLYEAGKSGYNTHELPARFLRAAIEAINAKGAL